MPPPRMRPALSQFDTRPDGHTSASPIRGRLLGVLGVFAFQFRSLPSAVLLRVLGVSVVRLTHAEQTHLQSELRSVSPLVIWI